MNVPNIFFQTSKPLYVKKKYKTKDLSIKMLYVINNPLATSDGFTGYSVGFGIKDVNASSKAVDTNVPDQSTVQGVSDGPSGAGGDAGGRVPS